MLAAWEVYLLGMSATQMARGAGDSSIKLSRC